MQVQIDFSPQVSERLERAAQLRGMDLAKLIENLVADALPPTLSKESENGKPVIGAKSAAAVEYFRRRIREEYTDDPEEIRKSTAEVEELMFNLNKNRVESGERPLFP